MSALEHAATDSVSGAEVGMWAYRALYLQTAGPAGDGGHLAPHRRKDFRQVTEVSEYADTGDRATFEVETSDGSVFEVIVRRKGGSGD